MKLECLTIPLLQTPEMALPCIIYEDTNLKVTLDKLNRDEIAKAFRISFDDRNDGSYEPQLLNPQEYIPEDHIFYFLHEAKCQIRVTPKTQVSVDEATKTSLSAAISCVLSSTLPFVSWQYTTHSRVETSMEFKNYTSQLAAQSITASHVADLQIFLTYCPSGNLPEHKLITLFALLHSATHQGSSRDVSCVLYFSILESIFVAENTELTYKLSMRLARFDNQDYDYSNTLRKLYSKRGKVIHGSSKGNVFTNEEQKQLEQLAKSFLIKFIANPSNFVPESLDRLLLQ